MSIGVNNRNDYVGNGATATYSYGWKIFEAGDLYVTQRDTNDVETVLEYPADFSVTGVGLAAGGTITLTDGALPNGYNLTIRRVVTLEQATDLRNQSAFFAEVHEDTFDYLMMAIQQQQDVLDRSLRLPETITPGSINVTLPVPEAGKALMWDADGINLISGDIVGLENGGISGATTNKVCKFISTTLIGNSLLFDNGSYVSLDINAAYIDATAWGQSLYRIARDQDLATNQFGMTIQLRTTGNTGAVADYEKAGLLIRAMTLDPSGATTRDMVGIDARGEVYTGCLTGRVWGGYFEGTVHPGADGFAIGIEVAVSNNGANQAEVNQTDSKYGVHITARGSATPSTGNLTAAIYMNGAGSTFYKGLYGRQDGFGDSFIELDKSAAFTNLFRVKPSGQTIIGDLPNNGATTDYVDTTYGALLVRELITVCDQTTNKRVLALFADTATSLHRIGGGRHGSDAADYWPLTIEAGGLEVIRAVVNGVTQFPNRGAVADTAPAGVGWLRYNDTSKAFEASVDTGAWAAISASAGTIGGSGTVNQVAKFTGSTTTVGDSSIFDDGTSVLIGKVVGTDPLRQKLEIDKNQNESSGILMRNTTSGTLARAAITARSNSGSLDITMFATSATYTTAGGVPALAGCIFTGTDATAGLFIQTGAGDITFQVGSSTADFTMKADGALLFATSTAAAGTGKLRFNGTNFQIDNGAGYVNISAGSVSGSGTANQVAKFTAGTVVGDSTIFDDGTSVLIGAVVAADATRLKLEVQKNQNESSGVLIQNTTSGTLARAAFVAKSGATGSRDITLLVTSATYTTVSGVPASAGLLYTGVDATAGLFIQTGAGDITFQVGGASADFTMKTDGALLFASSSAASGAGKIRFDGTNFQIDNGAGYVNLSTGTLGGTGTANQVAKFSASTTLADSTIFDDGTSVLIGKTSASDATRFKLEVEKNQNESTGLLIRNTTSGTLARAALVARSGTGSRDITIFATSATYTTAGGIPANAGVLYSGSDCTAGLYIQTGAGDIIFQVGGTGTDLTLKADGAIQFASTAAAAGAGKIRFDGTNFQIDNGAGYVNIQTSATASGWQDDGTTVRTSTTTDRVLVGFSTTDITDSGVIIANQALYVASASSNASVGALVYDSGSATVRLGSGISGAGTARALAFVTYSGGNQERARFHTNGNFSIGITTDAGYKFDVNGSMRAAIGTFTGLTNDRLTYTVGGGLLTSSPMSWDGTRFHSTSGNFRFDITGQGLEWIDTNSAAISGSTILEIYTQVSGSRTLTFKVDGTASSTLTTAWLYYNGTLKQVQVGAADSGGAGFRLLRISN